MLFFLASSVRCTLVFNAPASSNFDMSSYPALDVLTPLLDLNQLPYDFSKVPNIQPNTPLANVGPPTCRNGTSTTLGSTGSCLWSCGQCIRETDIVTCPGAFKWGLTFDDGPSPYTPPLLDYMAGKNMRATFFVIGSRVKEYPATLLRAFREGHQIGIHTWSHRALTTLSTQQIVSELEYTIRAVKQVIGTVPLYMRPPFGDIDDRVREICKAMNLIPVMWDFDSGDFAYGSSTSTLTPASFEKLFLDKATALSNLATNGVISIQHDLYQKTEAMAPGIIDKILSTKMVPQSVAECVRDFTPYTDKSYVLPNSLVQFKTGSNNSQTVVIVVIVVAVVLLAILGATLWYMRKHGYGIFRKSGKLSKNIDTKSSKDQITDSNRAFVMGPNV